jgi:hypothetical protein
MWLCPHTTQNQSLLTADAINLVMMDAPMMTLIA